MDDWALLRQYISGDKGAMESLIRRHIDFVYSTARRAARISPADADDITQAVFLLLTQKASGIQQRGTLVGWLHRATRWCAANLNKQERRRQRLHEEAAMHNTIKEATAGHAEAEWLEELDTALERLSERERAAVIARYLQQKSFAQAGEMLGLSTEAVRKRAERGLDKLRGYFLARNTAAPTGAAIVASLAATLESAPGAVLDSAVGLPQGAPAAAHIVALARGAPSFSAISKLPLALAVAAILAITGAIAAIQFQAAPTTTTAAAAPARPVTTTTTTAPQLARIELVAADPAHPTEAEVKTFLKARLERLNNLMVTYNVHTEYPQPAGGWPEFKRPPIESPEPPIGIIGGPAPLVGTMVADLSAEGHFLAIFPTGTSDQEKTFSTFAAKMRFDRKLTRVDRLIPYPTGPREFGEQTYIAHDNIVDRLFFDRRDQSVSASSTNAALPQPDIEIALGMATYASVSTNSTLPRAITAADIDALSVSAVNADHIIVTREYVMSSGRGAGRGTRGQTPATTTTGERGAPASNTPASIRTDNPGGTTAPAATRPPPQLTRDTWTLDRATGYAPTTYRRNAEFEMTMSDFHEVAGLSIPQKAISLFMPQTGPRVSSMFRGTSPANRLPLTTLPTGALPQPWRIETLTVSDFQIQSPANLDSRYIMVWPDGKAPNTQHPTLNNFYEIRLGADSFDSISLTIPFDKAIPVSTPLGRDLDWWIAAHEANLKRAKDGHLDLLLFGAGTLADWPQQHWKIPNTAAANFAIKDDTIGNILWRIGHGELDGIAPKVVVFMAGGVGHAGTARSVTSPSGITLSFWLPPRSGSGSADQQIRDYTSAVALAIHQICEKLPQSKIVLLGFPIDPALPKQSLERLERSRIEDLDTSLQKLDDGTTIRFLQLAYWPLDSAVPTDVAATEVSALRERWAASLDPLLKEMLGDTGRGK